MKMDGEKEKKMWKIKKILLFHHFTLKISDRGDLFSIPWTAYFNKFLPNSVNHDQDWMPIKFNPNLLNKLHPSRDRLADRVIHWLLYSQGHFSFRVTGSDWHFFQSSSLSSMVVSAHHVPGAQAHTAGWSLNGWLGDVHEILSVTKNNCKGTWRLK